MKHFLTLKSVDEILEQIRAFPRTLPEDVPLAEAQGRVLAEAFNAPEDLPGFNRSTMDGYAVRARDMFGASEGMPALLECLGECPMGEVPAFSIGPGQSARIWTGGMLPEGADAVVMLEYSREAGPGQVELTRPVAPLEHVIGADEDAARGEELIPAGRRLRAQELGLLAAFGVARVRVRKKPRVAVISSGDEVVGLAARPRPGQVRDINSHTLAALVERAGGESRLFGIVADSEAELLNVLSEAMSDADIILLSGGSSAGQRDFTVRAFAALGAEILAHGVAISPGKPLILARKGQKSLWGLPGHAASALVCAEVFIRPLLSSLSGCEEGPYRQKPRQAVLSRAVASAQGRRDYIRVSLGAPKDLAEPDTLPLATPVMGKSGLISTLVQADALIICPEDQEGLYAGQVVDFYELT